MLFVILLCVFVAFFFVCLVILDCKLTLTRVLSVNIPLWLLFGNVLPERLAFTIATCSVGVMHPTFALYVNYQIWQFWDHVGNANSNLRFVLGKV